MMDQSEFQIIMPKIETALKKAGYDPYAQLTGYLTTGDDAYITRTDGARKLIKLLSAAQIRQYLAEMKVEQND